MTDKRPGIFIKIITLTSVSLIILIFSAFSVFTHYDFVLKPILPKVIYSEELGGWVKPKLTWFQIIQKTYDALSLVFMTFNCFFILYRYYIAFFADPGTFTVEKNELIVHKPEKVEEIKEMSGNIYKDIIRVK